MSITNPYTGRKIKIGGPTYNSLLASGRITIVNNQIGSPTVYANTPIQVSSVIIPRVQSIIMPSSIQVPRVSLVQLPSSIISNSTQNPVINKGKNILEELSGTQISLITNFMTPDEIIRLCELGRNEICKDENSELWVKLLAKDFPNIERSDISFMKYWVALMTKRQSWLKIITKFFEQANPYAQEENWYEVIGLAQKIKVRGAFLYGANLSNYILAYLDFTRADTDEGFNTGDASNFSYANLSGTNLTQTNFSDANLTGANMIQAQGNIHAYNTIFVNANLSKAQFSLSIINRCDFTHAILHGTQFEGSKIHNSKFIGADLTDADFGYSIFANLNFTDAILIHTNFITDKVTNFKGMNFTRANLTDTMFPTGRVEGAIF